MNDEAATRILAAVTRPHLPGSAGAGGMNPEAVLALCADWGVTPVGKPASAGAVARQALLRIISPRDMAGMVFAPGEAMGVAHGEAGRKVMLVVAMLVLLGALSSSILATIRVTFALARDGLAFRLLSHMSRSQAPVPAFVAVGAFSVILVLNRDFMALLRIYFFAGAILFGLSYASLIIFRVRERTFPAGVYRCPLGMFQAALLIIVHVALAADIAVKSPKDVIAVTGLCLVLGLLYFFWRGGRRALE